MTSPETTPAPAPSVGAVFVSYASQDAEAAKRICESLRAAGVEVWFDQNELTGGDAWDRKIRGQIAACALFVPVISAATQARHEGYFRLEWKLAAQRTHLMSGAKAFLLPVVIDATRDAEAHVPEEFRAVQWTRLPGGEHAEKFGERVKNLFGGDALDVGRGLPTPPLRSRNDAATTAGSGDPALQPSRPLRRWLVPALLGAVIVAALALWQPWRPTPPTSAPATAKSIAVLPFVNQSDDKGNEYFSDGISEELLNVLAKIPDLKVKARTSSFSFKGKQVPLPEIARQLGVAYVIEGSVRKSGGKVRITAQLIKAADGFQVWSDNFERELKDVFAMQDEIAGLIAKNLSLKLGAISPAAKAAVNSQAFELYLQGRQAWNLRNDEGFTRAEQLLNRALGIDPNFARAHAALADVWFFRAQDKGIHATFSRPDAPELIPIIAKIRQALALDPESAEAHASLGNALGLIWKFAEAERELRRAIALNPNYASAHQWLGERLLCDGRLDEALAERKLATEIDPLSSRIADNYAYALYIAGRNSAALEANERAVALQPNNFQALGQRAWLFALLGRRDEAVALARQLPPSYPYTRSYQIIVFGAAGLRTEAEALLSGWDAEGSASWPKSFMLLMIGRREEAIAALDANSCESPWAYVDPIFDQIHDEPRFKKFLATIGLTDAQARAQAWRAAHPPEKAK